MNRPSFRRWFLIGVVLALVIPGAVWAQASGPSPESVAGMTLPPDKEVLLNQAASQVLCTCGCGYVLQECLCGTALASKNQMKAMILAGKSPDEIVAAYVAEHGEQYLAAPPKRGFDLSIWIFPGIAFLALTAILWAVLRRLLRPASAPSTPTDDALLERYREQIEKELRRKA